MRKVRVAALAVCAALFSVASAAVDAVWKTSAGSTAWPTAANWETKSGEAVSAAPITLDDSATFPEDGVFRSLTFNITRSSPATDPLYAFGAISGDFHTTLSYYTFQNSWDAGHPARVLTLGDTSDFYGYLSAGHPSATFAFDGNSAALPVLRNLDVLAAPTVSVPEGKIAAIGNLYRQGGALFKKGMGDLRLDGSLSGRERIYVKEGGVTFAAAVSGAALKSAFAKASIHLDASASETFETGTDEDGRTTVERWSDVSGNGKYAYATTEGAPGASSIKHPRAPYFSAAAKSPTGLPLVDFGSRPANPNYGPTNCLLRLSDEFAISEAIYVFVNPDGGNSVPVLGHNSDYPFHAGGASMLFYRGYAFSTVMTHDVQLNGKDVAYDSAWSPTLKSLSIVGASLSSTVKVNLLGCDRLSAASVGSVRVGEVLLFAERLTAAERMALTRHLHRKWIAYAPDAKNTEVDAGAIILSADTTIGVEKGSTAHVAQLTIEGDTLVKTGDGVLAIDRLYADANVNIDVRGGSVVFEKFVERPDGLTPPANPFIRLDASTGLVMSGDYITQWNDADGRDRAAQALTTLEAPRMPTVVAEACNGLDVIDFGKVNENKHTGMTLPSRGTAYAYAAFMVIRPKTSKTARNIFGSSRAEFYRCTSSSVLQYAGLRTPAATAAAWSVNGRPVDPAQECPQMAQTTDFFVIGLSGQSVMCIDQLFRDRDSDSMAGDFQMGEFLLYDRPLSESETIAAEAYLMKKWLKTDHPLVVGNEATTVCMAFAENKDVEVGGDMHVTRVSGGSGKVIKSDVDETTITVEAGAISSYAIKGGSLTVRETIPDADASFHFDAYETDTLTTYQSGEQTFVTHWADSRRIGLVAESEHIKRNTYNYSFAVTNPTLRQVEIEGVKRPVVHFGEKCSSTKSKAAWDAGTLPGGYTASSLEFPNAYSVRELFTVYADNREYGSSHYGYIGGSGYNSVTSLGWLREGGYMMFASYAAASSRNGYITVDGVEREAAYYYPSGFHVVALGPTAATPTETMCQDRNCNAGGGSIGEQIAFPEEMTNEQRQKIENYLLAKWKGVSNGINVAKDIDFAFAFDAEGNLGLLEYDSFLDFSEGVTFSFSAENRKTLQKNVRYPFLKLRELRGSGVVAPTIVVDDEIASRFGARVELVGDTYYLILEPRGILLIVR